MVNFDANVFYRVLTSSVGHLFMFEFDSRLDTGFYRVLLGLPGVTKFL